jgi:hypothetical protein
MHDMARLVNPPLRPFGCLRPGAAYRRRRMAPTAHPENAPISAPMRADRTKGQGTDPTEKAGQDWDSRDARCRVRTSDILLVRQALYR